MTIATSRTLIVPYTEQLEHDFILLNCCATNRAEMNGPHSISSAKRLFQELLVGEKHFARAVIDNSTREFIGHLAISNYEGEFELCFLIDKAHWGKGIATEVLRPFFSMACFELEIGDVFATVNTHHEASIKLLEKLGFNYQETKQDSFGPYYHYQFLTVAESTSYAAVAQSA
ncbi:N-acetyltransferase [Vibrio sp. T187]|uniref:GNAT family N-acetyltransferase n=1 Tax=Vibrio TaxID=662 RepID=UPI0010C9DDCB|nr:MULTISPECIES: GNAT family N-acetyltransferase [Vibrio]MBW3694342.1 N-acetyltransferase [Vibrio sp. T187]